MRARLSVPPEAWMAPLASEGDVRDPGAPPSEARDDDSPRQQAAEGNASQVPVVPGALRDAASANDTDTIERLLQAGVPADDPDGAPGTPFLTAVTAGATAATRLLLNAGASVGVIDPVSFGNAAHCAARCPDPECSVVVIEAITEASNSNSTVNGNTDKNPNTLNQRDQDGRTPLEIAFARRVEGKKIKADYGVPGNGITDSYIDGGLYRVTRALLDAGASSNVAFRNGASPLACAVARGDESLTALLLERGADPERGGEETIGKKLASPALVAIRTANAGVLSMLLMQGADCDSAAPCGSSAFQPSGHSAALFGTAGGARLNVAWAEVTETNFSETMFKESSSETANNASSTSTATALQLACSLGETECVRVLLAHGAAHDVPASMPPAVCAAAGGHAEVVELLLSQGAMDPWTCDDRGATALHYAAARGHVGVVELLAKELVEIQADEDEARAKREACARKTSPQEDSKDSESPPPQKSTATFLDSASFMPLKSLFQSALSLSKGSDKPISFDDSTASERANLEKKQEPPPRVSLIDVADVDGQTALYAACAEGRVEAVSVLVTCGADINKRFPPNNEALLHVAAAFDRSEVVIALTEREKGSGDSSSLVNSVDALGRTPLVVAAAAGAVTTCLALLDAGADPNGAGVGVGVGDDTSSAVRSDDTSATTSDDIITQCDPPTIIAAHRGEYRLVQELVKRGATITPTLESLGVPYISTPSFFRERGQGLQGHSSQITTVAFHPSDPAICATVGKDGALRIYREAETADEQAYVSEYCDGEYTTVKLGDDTFVPGTGRWTLGVSFRCHDVSAGGVSSAAWSHGGDHVVTAGADGRVNIWSLPKTQKAPQIAMQSDTPVFDAQWSPCDSRIVVATGEALSFWCAKTGRKVMTALAKRGGGKGRPGDVKESYDSSSATNDDLTRCAHAKFKKFVACAGVTGDDGVAVSLCDAERGSRTARAVTFSNAVGNSANKHSVNRVRKRIIGGCRLDSDDSRLVTCDLNGWVRVWDTRLIGNALSSDGVVTKWRAHNSGGVSDCVFSPDGRYVATSSADGTCVLWDVRRGAGVESVCVLQTRQSVGFGSCCFSSNGLLFSAATKSDDANLLHRRGVNVAVVWEGD